MASPVIKTSQSDIEAASRNEPPLPQAIATRAIVALAQTDAAVKGAERDPVFAVERLLGVISARGGV